MKVSGPIPGAGDPFWTSPGGPREIAAELGPQLIANPQWPNPSIKKAALRAVRSESEIAIFAEWEDATENAESTPGGQYTDQIALLFPLGGGGELPPITMGAEGREVNVWQWKAMWQKALALNPAGIEDAPGSLELPAKRLSPVEDLNAEGFSTLTRQERQDVFGNGVWSGGAWRVVFKRALSDSDPRDVRFKGPIPMVVAVWDGGNRETNGQKGLSNWILLNFS
ncbi:MAG: hypothetical protein HZA02_01490 [Nitrospinae bacterium]|nr:hypothetical protein [Nitrospinota bacterium]